VGTAKIRSSSHGLFPTSLDEPTVHWVGREKAKNHPDLHHEPVARFRRLKVRMGEDNKERQSHPSEKPGLKSDNGERIGFDRRDQSLA
jgi:hypothetical protein